MMAMFLLVLVLLGFYLSWRATRLDRLHHRVEAARAALDAALLRRAAAALDLATSSSLDPREGRALTASANRARRAGDEERELAESDLSATLCAMLTHPRTPGAPAPRLEEVLIAGRGVHMARVFHNDAVSDTRRARRSRLVRLLRLAGTAALPDYFEMDDRVPGAVLPQGGTAAR